MKWPLKYWLYQIIIVVSLAVKLHRRFWPSTFPGTLSTCKVKQHFVFSVHWCLSVETEACKDMHTFSLLFHWEFPSVSSEVLFSFRPRLSALSIQRKPCNNKYVMSRKLTTMEVCMEEIDNVASSHYFHTNHMIFPIFLENMTAKNHENFY